MVGSLLWATYNARMYVFCHRTPSKLTNRISKAERKTEEKFAITYQVRPAAHMDDLSRRDFIIYNRAETDYCD